MYVMLTWETTSYQKVIVQLQIVCHLVVNCPEIQDPVEYDGQVDLNGGTKVQVSWEIEQAQHVKVEGRLKECLSFWREVLQVPTLIIDYPKKISASSFV